MNVPELHLGGILRNGKGGEWRVLQLQRTRDGNRFTQVELLALADEQADLWHRSFKLSAGEFRAFCAREGIEGFGEPE